MKPCLFCEIVTGNASASILYQDETTLAFMNLRQGNAGHVLVIPKPHIATIFALEPALAADLSRTVLRVAHALKSTFQPDGLNIWQSNGESAGQEIDHIHIHLLPRKTDDNLLQFYTVTPPHAEKGYLDELAEKITPHLK